MSNSNSGVVSFSFLTPKKPREIKSWDFKVVSRTQINWKEIANDLCYKYPIAFVDICGHTEVWVHGSLLWKEKHAVHKDFEGNELIPKRPYTLTSTIFTDIKSSSCSDKAKSEWIEWAKAVKKASWINEMRDGGKVKIILPEI